MSTELPPCEQRELTEREGVFFCRHPQVRVAHGLVSAAICQWCSVRERPVTQPRPREQMLRPAEQHGTVGATPTAEREWPGPDSSSFPSLPQQGWNLARSLTAFIADGFKTVTKEQYEQRLQICDTCDRRRGTRCLQCGCGLTLKAQGRAFQCPLKKWPIQNTSH